METFYLILLGLAGVLLHIGLKFRDYVTKYGEGKTLKEIWIEFPRLGIFIPATFSALIVILLVLVRDEITNFFPMTKISVIFLGYMADSVFKNLEGYFTKRFQIK